MINLNSLILKFALKFSLYFQIEQSRAITLFTFSKISQEKKLKNRQNKIFLWKEFVCQNNKYHKCLSFNKKKSKMGDETPKKSNFDRSITVPSSLPKPTFLPEPKSFSTKKVRLPNKMSFYRLQCVWNVNLKIEQDWTCLLKLKFYQSTIILSFNRVWQLQFVIVPQKKSYLVI